MRKRSFLFGALAALALVGCSDDELGKGNEVIPSDGKVFYTNISVAMAGNGTSRAWGDPEFEYGENNENTISELLLVFYDATGHVMGNTTLSESDLKELKPENSSTALPGATLMYQGAVEVRLNPTSDTKPSQVMVYANPQAANDHRDPLSSIMTATRNDYKTAAGAFTMNNSVYYNGNDLVTSVAVKADDFYPTKEAAEAAADKKTTIYIERMAAKVGLKVSESLKNEPFKVNDNTYLKFDITNAKWGLSGTEKKMFLIKNLPAKKSTDPDFSTWAWDGTNRSYWACSYSYSQGDNSSIGGNPDAQFPLYGESTPPADGWALNYISYDKAVNAMGTTAYCLENTGRAAQFTTPSANGKEWNPYATTTNVIIAGNYVVTSDAAGNNPIQEFSNKTFYYWGSDLYLDDDIIDAMVASQIFIYSDEDCTTRVTSVENFAFKNDPTNAPSSHYFIQIPAVNENLYCKYTDDEGNEQTIQLNTIENLTTANEQLKGRYVAVKFNQGHAFFSVPIEHHGKFKEQGENNETIERIGNGTYGVVRNHVYKLTVNSIKGLANGVDDDEPLIPEPTENVTWWVGCDTYVMQWHVVSQGVDL